MLKKIFYGIIFSLFFTSTFGFNIGIAPTGFYASLDKNETHEIMVTNNTAEPVRVEISARAAKGWESYNIGDMMRIYPKSITIKPNGSRSVRFAVRGAKELADGEYKANLVFKEVGSGQIMQQTVQADNGTDVAVNFELLTEIHMAAYGMKGKRDVKGQLISSEIKKDKNGNVNLVANFSRSGNSGLAVVGDIEYLDANKRRVGKDEVKIGITSRETNTRLERNLVDIPANSKFIKVNYRDKDGLKLGSRELSL
ncbi:hypothetical protein [Cetobacterium sp. ZOR0034]|uniref:COG1470 family protein n=1 Tax=Cetobacterium sp. ZOR0034 TaxID=1339239 RepID=UPI0006482DC4|nr:hypothetical protein [Cetobacterium sp. ZOR0034]